MPWWGKGVLCEPPDPLEVSVHETIEARFRSIAPSVDFCSLRLVQTRNEDITVRQDVLQPVRMSSDIGAMITIQDEGSLGYAATSDLSASGLKEAARRALDWCHRTAGRSVIDYRKVSMPRPDVEYRSPALIPWDSVPLSEKLDLLKKTCAALKTDDRIVDWEAGLWFTEEETLYLTMDGGRAVQNFQFLVPNQGVVVNEGTETFQRTMAARGFCRQGGLEILESANFQNTGAQLSEEALQLLSAPNCPDGEMDLLLAPDQMLLQIHESIGHPLELDRILGDERNYAGTSFVTLDMFGSYRYGSDLLNITYDPTRKGEFASYGVDDDGVPAQREYIIRDGILERPLGSVISQARAGIEGVANSRADSWNRPPIDRMANLNLEAGNSSLEDMIKSVEKGVYMKTNCSWSIDDSRNKFQFGCEWAQLIEDGELTTVVRKPNYRGVSATFWRALKSVGNERSVETLGSPYCGKGEPNQCIRVGHASPACLFDNISVFGGV